ncbi:tRNA (guanosine(46)-N7)-methyltransferase TrmB [Cellulosimicrobium cellulans]|uniref:tRNA (guanosine(46)-N7)-methyltransferase TrmB n=1 Tax=Cellulosimicrobium cellulans TaxID=1710 RepID=UPI00209AB4A5|nr:tRNA (guanosine(46)-N7)-methyltransferase TrmB [Cellulosimicrobium cellulans]
MPEPLTAPTATDPTATDPTASDPSTTDRSATAPEAPARRYRTQPVSFVRRSGRLGARQQKAWDAHRDRYLLDVPRDVARTSVDPSFVVDPQALFGRSARLVVEIGSGQGEAVVAAAEADPGTDFLAVEVYTPGLAQTVLRAAQRDLTNLRLVQVNAAELLATTLPEDSVDELWVFFPDPWHKSRHHKRRLVTSSFAELAARVLRAPSDGVPGGTLRLATDWAEYAEQMLEVLDAAPGFRNAHGPGGVAPRFDGRVLTGFERKGEAAGRVITDLEYIRV